MRRGSDPRRLGPIGTVAAWLRVWTPPRDAVVPPVPWRRLAVAGVVAALALAGLAALVLPRLEAARRATAEREARQAAVAARARRERIVAEQRPRAGRAAPARAVKPGGGAPGPAHAPHPRGGGHHRRRPRARADRRAAGVGPARHALRALPPQPRPHRGAGARPAPPQRDLRLPRGHPPGGRWPGHHRLSVQSGGALPHGPLRLVQDQSGARRARGPDPRTVVRLPAACAGAPR